MIIFFTKRIYSVGNEFHWRIVPTIGKPATTMSVSVGAIFGMNLSNLDCIQSSNEYNILLIWILCKIRMILTILCYFK